MVMGLGSGLGLGSDVGLGSGIGLGSGLGSASGEVGVSQGRPMVVIGFRAGLELGSPPLAQTPYPIHTVIRSHFNLL